MPETENTKDLPFTKIFFAVNAFFLIVISFFVIVFLTSKWGVGLSTDSAGYLAGARNILNGNGLSLLYDSNGSPLITWLPMTDNLSLQLYPWPPFFPLLLSFFGFLKLNLFQSGRFLNALLFGANIFLVTLIIKKYLKSIFLTVFAALILIISKDMIQIHSMLWSEPLFIFLSLIGFLFLFDFLENRKIFFLVIASLFFSLAFFTRNIGISLAAASAASVLVYSELKLKNKIIYSAMSVLIIILPFSIWTLKNNLTYGASPAELIFHPVKLKHYYRILDTVSLWVIANKTSEKSRIILISVLIFAVILIASFIYFKNKKKPADSLYKLNSKITGTLLFYILFYFLALFVGRYFFDESIVVNENRMLLPVLIALFIVLLFFLKRFTEFYSQNENIKILAYVFCGLMIAA
ncbi:MAG: glycosyltransferase family protein, partial [Candidatus Humimicrobiaceae bacterium]